MDSMTENVVFQAKFDPKLKLYLLLYFAGIFLIALGGIVLIPFWFLGWGQWLVGKQYRHLQCLLTERSLVVRRGVLFKTEKTIPLDKIQDLTLKEGPLLRASGLCSLKVETAGQSTPQGSSEANLIGIIDARRFRNRVLEQRDAITAAQRSAPLQPEASQEPTSIEALLTDMLDSLRRIENLLKKEQT